MITKAKLVRRRGSVRRSVRFRRDPILSIIDDKTTSFLAIDEAIIYGCIYPEYIYSSIEIKGMDLFLNYLLQQASFPSFNLCARILYVYIFFFERIVDSFWCVICTEVKF